MDVAETRKGGEIGGHDEHPDFFELLWRKKAQPFHQLCLPIAQMAHSLHTLDVCTACNSLSRYTERYAFPAKMPQTRLSSANTTLPPQTGQMLVHGDIEAAASVNVSVIRHRFVSYIG